MCCSGLIFQRRFSISPVYTTLSMTLANLLSLVDVSPLLLSGVVIIWSGVKSKVYGRPLNLLECVKPVHELSKRPLKPIIYDLVPFRPNQLLTLWTPSSLIALSPSRTSNKWAPSPSKKNKNKLAPSPNYLLPLPVCSCSSTEGGEGVEAGCGYRISGKLRLSALGAGDVGRKQSHWSRLPSQDRRMVAMLRPKGAPPPVYGEFDRCLFSSNHWIW
jgi:hypothetical protein